MCIGEKARAIEKEIGEVLNDANRHFRIEVDEVNISTDWRFVNDVLEIEEVEIRVKSYSCNINVLWVIERVLDDIEKEWEVKFMNRCVRV